MECCVKTQREDWIDLKEIRELRQKRERERKKERDICMKKETLTKTKKGLHHCMMRKMPFFPRPYHKASLPRKTRNTCYIQ